MIFLVWQFVTFDPDTHTALFSAGQERHLTVESCLSAKAELLTIAGIGSRCIMVGEPPARTEKRRAIARAVV
jgi:hypothetical protein